MKTLLRFFLWILVLPGLFAGAFWALNNSGFFKLEQIDLTLTKNTEQSRFMRPLVTDLDKQLETLRGKNLWAMDLIQVQEQISNLPWVQDLQLRRHWPDRLEIQIVPKEVVFLFMGKGGQLFPVLNDGTFLNSVNAESLPDVVILRGDEFFKNKKLLKQAIEMREQIPAEGSFSRASISELRFDNKEGFWATMMGEGVQVKIGEDQFVTKADRVSQVLDYLQAHRLDARVIDANLTKKVLVRLRKGP